MRSMTPSWQGLGIDRETMVHRGDLDLPVSMSFTGWLAP